jgi:RNA polymerase sigma-70 factor (ECF subfamily)
MLGRERAVVATGGGQVRERVFCLASPGTADDRLRDFLTAQAIELVVERRARERRRRERRAGSRGAVGNARRVVRNEHGRRVADRRSLVLEADGWSAVALDEGVRLVRVQPPSAEERLSVESLRLVVRFQGGDASAFLELHRLWADELWSYFNHHLRDHHAAEDAAQEMAAKFVEGLRDYEIRRGVPFQAWLFRLARNHVVDRSRSNGRLKVMDPWEVAELLEECAEPGVPASGDGLASWALDGVLGAVRLPARQRQVIELRFGFDLTPGEIAHQLGLSEGTVRQLQHRALTSLKQRFCEPAAERRVLRASMRRRPSPLPVVQTRRMALLAP